MYLHHAHPHGATHVHHGGPIAHHGMAHHGAAHAHHAHLPIWHAMHTHRHHAGSIGEWPCMRSFEH